jgi:hypothetical protein
VLDDGVWVIDVIYAKAAPDDLSSPVHAWAALRVFELDGSSDFAFLERMLERLLLNFTWWVNREDGRGDNVFGGGFLGLDNISPIDRSALPAGEQLEESDATGWMARYCLDMLRIAVVLAEHDPVYEDVAVKFALQFAAIATALGELWDADDGFYYDRLRLADGSCRRLRVHSIVGLIPLLASTRLTDEQLGRLPELARALDRPSHQTGWTGLLALLLVNGQLSSDTSTTVLRPAAR